MDSHKQPSLGPALDLLWARFRPEMEERVAALESAAEAFKANTLSSNQREEARGTAHKLAGVLGTFGLTRGTDLARELEVMYSQEDGDPTLGEQLAGIAFELRTIVTSRK